MRLTPIAAAIALTLTGCSTLVAYHPQVTSSDQSLRFAQGVGTLSERDADHEIFIYPTYKVQGPQRPTFTVGYANNSALGQDFSTANIRAFYRGAPVPIYSYQEMLEEIRQDKLGKQVALAILGVGASVAAANAASHQTYQSNYSGAVANRYGVTRVSGSSTLRVYDPGSGLIAGAAVAGGTGLGIQQIEYNANNQARAAEMILQANTVDPQRFVTGQLILKGCCDMYGSGPDDAIRFEVTANGKTSVFQFLRLAGGAAPPPQQSVQAMTAPQPIAVAYKPTVAPLPVETSEPRPVPTSQPLAPISVTAAASPPPGKDAYQAEHLAEARACQAVPRAVLSAKGPGFETYSVSCTNGDALAIRCEFGNCRVLR